MNFGYMIEEAQTRVLNERDMSARRVIGELQELWEHRNDDETWRLFNFVAVCLVRTEYVEEVWQWLLEKLVYADAKLQIDATISILELISEEPLDIQWLERLFSTWLVPGLEWIIISVYEEQAELLHEHLVVLKEHRWKQHEAYCVPVAE